MSKYIYLPFSELEDYVLRNRRPKEVRWVKASAAPRLVTDCELARIVSFSRDSVWSWRHNRHGIRLSVAVEIADHLKAHPIDIWGEHYVQAELEFNRRVEHDRARRQLRDKARRRRHRRDAVTN